MSENKSWREFIKTVTYKPNWKFEIEEGWEGQEVLAIKVKLEDSRNPGSPALVTNRIDLRMFESHGDSNKQSILRSWINKMEQHEIDEWLRFGGVLVFDPHKDER